MAAARWTAEALDITSKPHTWDQYLTAEQLSDRIDLKVDTIMDTLNRKLDDPADPRNAINRPAYRIGPTALNAMPRWTVEQADAYIAAKAARVDAGKLRAEQRRKLPVYKAQDAAKAGLAPIVDLAAITGKAENSLRWWSRSRATFPPEVGIAHREGDNVFGPPLGLWNVRAVKAWVADPANVRVTGPKPRRRAKSKGSDGAATSAA